MSKSERAQSQIDTEMQSILEQPNILVGKMITNCCEDSSDSMKKWFEGTISGMSVAQNIIEYKVLYKDESVPVYLQFDEIVSDIRMGDMVVLWE